MQSSAPFEQCFFRKPSVTANFVKEVDEAKKAISQLAKPLISLSPNHLIISDLVPSLSRLIPFHLYQGS